MISLAFIFLAVTVGVVLAALDGPYPRDKTHTERASTLVVVAGAVTVAAGGALALLELLPG